MITPPLLKSGDKISIVASARAINAKDLEPCIKKLRDWEFIPVLGKNLFQFHNIFAGTDEQRLEDIQLALDNPEIKAVLFARGGYGTLRILDKLSLEGLKKNPKWLIGFSDLTPLLIRCMNEGIECIHGPMGVSFSGATGNEDSIQFLKSILTKNETLRYSYKNQNPVLVKKGSAHGQLIGGCLSLLHHCIGTKSDFSTLGRILILEDTDEYLYHLDRLFLHLNRAGKFSEPAGVIIGSLTGMKDNPEPYGYSPEEIALHNLKDFKGPLCTNFPIGHSPLNYPFILGRNASLIINTDISELVIESVN